MKYFIILLAVLIIGYVAYVYVIKAQETALKAAQIQGQTLLQQQQMQNQLAMDLQNDCQKNFACAAGNFLGNIMPDNLQLSII